MNQIVVHYRDGRIIKGTAQDLYKARSCFHMEPAKRPGKSVLIQVADIKAIFFVHALHPPTHDGRGHAEEIPKEAAYGRKAKVVFHDDETIVGFVQSYSSSDPLLLIVPEERGNNDRIFINKKCVKHFQWMEKESPTQLVNPFD